MGEFRYGVEVYEEREVGGEFEVVPSYYGLRVISP